jgi:hypothetical protein
MSGVSAKCRIMPATLAREILPCGEGLFAFRDEAGVRDAVETINKDYRRHCDAALRVAEEYFKPDKVLGEVLRACGLPAGTSSSRRV